MFYLILAKRNNAVLIIEEDRRSIEEKLNLSSIPGVKESILEASKTPDDEFLSEEEFMKILDKDETD